MFGFLKKVLIEIGRWGEYKNDTYESNYDGHWVDRGRGNKENWVWKEPKPTRTLYVSVFNLEKDYIITVGFNPRANALDVIECVDEREAEHTVRYLSIYYGTLGNVVTHKEVE